MARIKDFLLVPGVLLALVSALALTVGAIYLFLYFVIALFHGRTYLLDAVLCGVGALFFFKIARDEGWGFYLLTLLFAVGSLSYLFQ